jgi:hypothetical protein
LRQGVVRTLRRELVIPGADVLADVTAEDPVAHIPVLRGIDLPSMLDGEVGDAQTTVEYPFGREGIGGASLEAARAGSASIGIEGSIQPEVEVG